MTALLCSCAPVVMTKVQLVLENPEATSNHALRANTASDNFGVEALDDSLCYALHITADDLMVMKDSRGDGPSCADQVKPVGLGQLEGMFSFQSTNAFEFSVKVGRARKFDLIGFRKSVRLDLLSEENPNPDAAPEDCPRNLKAVAVDERDQESGQLKKKIALYSGTTKFEPQELILATGTQDIVLGSNTVTLSLVHHSDGSIGKRYGGDCGNSIETITAPTALSYPNFPSSFVAGTPITTSIVPTVVGEVNTFSVYPTLPTGLYFDSATGAISGTPSSAATSQTYTVTASNSAGAVNTTITFGISAADSGGGGGSKRIFVTSVSYTGNLGGVSGADAKCNADLNTPASGSYKALLVTSSSTANPRIACTSPGCSSSGANEHVDWVIAPDTQYTQPDGTVIGTSSGIGLLNLPLTNAFSSNSTLVYWTGFKYDSGQVEAFDWTPASTYNGDDNTCVNWTSSDGGGAHNGKRGISGATNFQSLVNWQDWCDTQHSLVCVEQ